MKMSTKMFLLAGLFVFGLVVLSAGTAHASGYLYDTGSLTYQNQAGTTYNTWSINQCIVQILLGPSLAVTKDQRRWRGSASGAYSNGTIIGVYGDSITYHLRVTNAAGSDTAWYVWVIDTMTFITAITNTDSCDFESTSLAGDSSTGVNSGCSNGDSIDIFQYTTDGVNWSDAGSATSLASIPASLSLRGLKWRINHVSPGCEVNIKFTVILDHP